MAAKQPSLAWYSTALVGVPAVYAAVSQLTYSVALEGGPWPAESYWLVLMTVMAGFGTWAIARRSRFEYPWNIAGAVLYFPLMIAVLFGISFVVSCSNGDCL